VAISAASQLELPDIAPVVLGCFRPNFYCACSETAIFEPPVIPLTLVHLQYSIYYFMQLRFYLTTCHQLTTQSGLKHLFCKWSLANPVSFDSRKMTDTEGCELTERVCFPNQINQ